MTRWLGALVVLGGLSLFAALQCTFLVTEPELALLIQFGKPVGEPILEPGLYFKLPFVQEVHRFEKRFMEWDGERNQLPTRDKRFIFVDTYARWRISDPLKFYQRLRDERGAQSRLDDILDGECRNVIARHDLIEAVRTSNREFAKDDEEIAAGEQGTNEKGEGFQVTQGRDVLADEVLKAAQGRTADLGIEILDFQFKRLNYVKAVQAEVYSRMISERRRIAEQFRSEGQGQAARINGEKERELARITSDAFRLAEETRGKADAEAANVYAAAYSSDPEFYSFLRSLETLQSVVDGQTTIVLGTEGDLFKYLESPAP